MSRSSPGDGGEQRLDLTFDDNRLLPMLYGEHDSNLARIEHQLGVALISRGNVLTVKGPPGSAGIARDALGGLWDRVKRGQPITPPDVDAAVRLAGSRPPPRHRRPSNGERPPESTIDSADGASIQTRRRVIRPRSPTQIRYVETMQSCELVFGLGPAGTGKTYLAVAQAVAMLLAGQIDRIVLSRPAVEAGERLGFLPGDLQEKVDPYLRPIYDALHDMLPGDQVAKRLADGQIEIAPLAFMRGRTLSHSFVILDEAQNTTQAQMKMALTRLGEGSRFVVTGDLTQVDLPTSARSGLQEAVGLLENVEGVGIVRFNTGDVVRHPLVSRIVDAYDRHAEQQRSQGATQTETQ